MARKQIELYNFDKYQPVLPAPAIDRIEGNADEMVLSADGYEPSASGGLPGSMTINANGGVWVDTGPGVTCEVSSSYTTTTSTTVSGTQTFLTFSRSAFRAANIQAIVQSGSTYMLQPLTVIHNNSDVTVDTGTCIVAGNSNLNVVYTGEITSSEVILKIAGVPQNTIVKCVIRYTLV